MYRVQRYCHIRNNEISLDGQRVLHTAGDTFSAFIRAAYQHLNLEYSKFFKMDNLSKLAFIGAELLLRDEDEKNIGLVFSNRAASLDTDRKHQASLESYASPATFVYTLPNICLGEISIRHQLFSENAFFVFERFEAETMQCYANSLLDEKKADKVLCGWVDFDHGKYDAFLYVVAKNGTFVHAVAELNQLYVTQ